MDNQGDPNMLIVDNDSNQEDHIERVCTSRRSCLNQSTNAFNKLTGMSDAALRETQANIFSPRVKNKKLKPLEFKELDISIK